MPTAITHAVVAIAAGKMYTIASRTPMPWKFWTLAMICSAVPDLDVGLHSYGVEYEDLWGHRGMMHSLLFALAVAIFVVAFFFRDAQTPRFGTRWWSLVLFYFLITASHGFFDAFTNGGLGIAFFSPFDETRYFFPWQPIEVSNFGVRSLFTARGAEVLWSEIRWVWLPVGIATSIWLIALRFTRPQPIAT